MDPRVRATVGTMMAARGLTDEEGFFCSDAQRILVVYVEKLSVAQLRDQVLMVADSGVTGLLFVTSVLPGAVMRQAIAESAVVVAIEVFAQIDLVFDIMTHELVPSFEVLSDAAKRDLLAKYKIRITQMPRILMKDPCVRYLNLQRGAVVKIIRQPADAEEYATYRVVV